MVSSQLAATVGGHCDFAMRYFCATKYLDQNTQSRTPRLVISSMGARRGPTREKRLWQGTVPPVEGILKRYPEIGDRPKKVLSNPREGSIEPLKRFYRTPKGSIEAPFFGPQKRSYRTLVRRTSEP